MHVKQEDLGDLPLLGHLIKQSPLISCLDTHFPVHGNWRAPSVGKLVTGWLLYIISECDHRLSPVEDWSKRHLNVLRHILECPDLGGSAFQDDRLGKLLEYFSLDDRYLAFQSDYNSRLLRLYGLEQETVRVDSFNAPSYREAGGLFQFGYHKSHQADMPHLKTMLVTLDPLALPVATYTVSGAQNDDCLYVPAIEQARHSLQRSGLLYVGDTKMGSLDNCSHLASTHNYYLCPLSHSYYPKELLRKGIEQANCDTDGMQAVYRTNHKSGEKDIIAKVYELPARQRRDEERQVSWSERLILVLSVPYAQAQGCKLEEGLKKARLELLERFLPRKFRRIWKRDKMAEAQAFVDKTLSQHRVKNLLNVELSLPPDADGQTPIAIHITPKEEAIQEALTLSGWRIYVSNAPAQKLSPTELLQCYRDEYRIEQQFHRLLTKTTNLLPIHLKDENRITALLRLLTLAMQFVAVIQHNVRQQLKDLDQALDDLVPGNKNRKVQQPTTELMLRRFKGVAAVWVQIPDQPIWATVTNLEQIHYQILHLLRCPDDLYEQVARAFQNVKELA